MAGLGEIDRFGGRLHGGANGVGAIVGGNAGGHPLGGLDADREIGPHRRSVVADHRCQRQLRAALAGKRQTDQAARVGDHEVDVGRPHQLSGHDQIALVLAVFVIDDHHHPPGTEFIEKFGDAGKSHVRFVGSTAGVQILPEPDRSRR